MHRASQILLMTIAAVAVTSPAMAGPPVRIKDITRLEGEHHNQLTGIGLVTGLQGTGGTSVITKRVSAQLLQSLGIRQDPSLRENPQQSQEKTNNLSVVIVTVNLPPHATVGQRIDVLVSAYDNATSLSGGVLQRTALEGPDGEIYAVASGPISLDGGNFGGQAATVTKNHSTTGRVASGATVERSVPTTVLQNGTFRLQLHQPEYRTADRIAAAINTLSPNAAYALDPATIAVRVPVTAAGNPLAFVAACQEQMVVPDTVARVVINERTGTIVIGENVRLSQVAITHGNLIVSTVENPEVSQPNPLSQGETTVVPRTTTDVTEEGAMVNVLDQNITVGDLAASLNALGVSPRDLSTILQMLRESGALHAELELR